MESLTPPKPCPPNRPFASSAGWISLGWFCYIFAVELLSGGGNLRHDPLLEISFVVFLAIVLWLGLRTGWGRYFHWAEVLVFLVFGAFGVIGAIILVLFKKVFSTAAQKIGMRNIKQKLTDIFYRYIGICSPSHMCDNRFSD